MTLNNISMRLTRPGLPGVRPVSYIELLGGLWRGSARVMLEPMFVR